MDPEVVRELKRFGRATPLVLVGTQLAVAVAAFLSHSTWVVIAVWVAGLLAWELAQRWLLRTAGQDAAALLRLAPRTQRLGWRGSMIFAASVVAAVLLMEWTPLASGHDVFFPMVFSATFIAAGFGMGTEYTWIRDLSEGRLSAADAPQPLYRQSAALPEALAAQALRAAQDVLAWRLVNRMLVLSLAWWLLLVWLQYVDASARRGLLVASVGPIAAVGLWKVYQRQMRRWQDEYWGGCHRCGVAFQGDETDSLLCPACGARWRLRLPPRTGLHPRGGATLTIWVVALGFALVAFASAQLFGLGFRPALGYAQLSAIAGVLAGLSIHGRRLLARDAPWVFD